MNQHLERLVDCAPFVRDCGLELIDAAKTQLGFMLLVVRGYESTVQQWKRYQQGRRYDRAEDDWVIEDPAQVVTYAKGGTSGHNVITRAGQPASVCLDVIPLDQVGQPLWALQGAQYLDSMEQPHQLDHRWIQTYDRTEEACWTQLYELSWKYGLDPYGDKIGAYLARDKGHLEEPAWKRKLEGLGLVLPSAIVSRAM